MPDAVPEDSRSLRALLKANRAVIEHLDLPSVLERIVEAAVELVGAQYGALGVVSPEGGLEQFINVGMSPHQVAMIGHLPEGHGVLGALIDDPHAIRVPHLHDHPLSVGFPEHHPPMESFLGVPVRVRDEVYGNLYLSNQASGEFSAEHEQLVTALAATAGIAIENARLFAETRRRQQWAAASAEITAALLAAEDGHVTGLIADQVRALCDADVVWMLRLVEQTSTAIITTARGASGSTSEVDVAGSLVATVFAERVAAQGEALGFASALAVPLAADDELSVLFVARQPGRPRFPPGELALVADFADRASVAIELAAARAARQRVALLEDRGRIARDLHDHVIQQLFATGLDLQSIAGTSTQSGVSDRIAQSVVNLDASISQIRTVIFALSAASSDRSNTVRHALVDLVNELSPRLARTPNVSFSGPVDLVITADLADDVVAVTREALVNVIKHADAESTSVELAIADGSVVLAITDDGHGAGGSTRRSGVANLAQRAEARGGTFTFDSTAAGTRLVWRVPFDSTSA